MTVLLLIAGFIFLVKGADLLVDGGAALAEKYGIPDIVVGLTIVAFGTSAPELVVNLIASFKGSSEIAMGNILGSNMANILLILGAAALLTPIKVSSTTLRFEIPFNFFVTAVLGLLAYNFFTGSHSLALSRWDGLFLVIIFGVFWWYIIRQVITGKEKGLVEIENHEATSLPIGILKIVAGISGLFFGGEWLVKGAVSIASSFNVSEGLIGVTIVAVGTSLPELAAAIAAARKKKIDFILGNVIGSNLFNILWVLGVSSLIKPLPYRLESNLDIVGNLLTGALLFGILWFNKSFLGKKTGLLFLILYALYIFLSVKIRG